MRSLACSLDDYVLADAIIIPPRPPIQPTNTRKLRDVRLLSLDALPATSILIFLCINCYLCTRGMIIFYMYNTNE